MVWNCLCDPQGKTDGSMAVLPQVVQASQKTAASLRKLEKLLSNPFMKN